MNGKKETEIAINYVHTQIQTVVSDLHNTILRMNNILIQQIEHSSHLNHELEEMKLGLIDLAKGKLSPLLIHPEILSSTLHDIQKLLGKNYPGFHLAYKLFRMFTCLVTFYMLETIVMCISPLNCQLPINKGRLPFTLLNLCQFQSMKRLSMQHIYLTCLNI